MRVRTTAALAALVVAGSLPVAAAAQEPAEQVINGDFSNGTAPWFSFPDAGGVTDGVFCTTVPGGLANPWDAIVGQNDIALIAGETYQFSFDASSTPPANVRALVGLSVEPFTAYFASSPVADETMRSFSFTFTQPDDTPSGQVAFQLGGALTGREVCLDNVSLAGGAAPEPYEPDTGPRVRVNQVGYLPRGPKSATLVTEATRSVNWQLNDAGGRVVATGRTAPAGVDPTSGLNVHEIDFRAFERPGVGFTLTADGETSHPFDIAADAYERLRVDALSFYYPQRSGMSIDGAVAGVGYARPAGHVGVAPNQGDTAVGCQPAAVSLPIYGQPWTCDYVLDVTGGWYDAGDHGKYVVNGGISVYQLMSTWERTALASTADGGALADGTLRVPETGNGVPDVLDEASWELEWMLKMQVPQGQPLAGMFHHKIHDSAWTGLPLMPHLDAMRRELHRPSTAATLNLAAVAAQGARIFDAYDPAFAGRLLAAARVAWAAANAHPALYAPVADGNSGGGPYDDTNVTDEFYWAAAELYITTREVAFANAVRSSPLHDADVFELTGFDWGHVAALGRLDLAAIPNGLPGGDKIDRSVLDAADQILAVQRRQPWGQAYAPEDNFWAWGSNSQILNNMVVLATAFDLSGRNKYRDGVIESLDFLLGRNALNISYITGYGDVFSRNQHSRWYANQLRADLPNPPNGSLAGGPNSGIQDPVAQALLPDCPATPQFCYIDDIESWSTNEITINWNATLSWVASFVADQDEGRGRS